MGWRKRSFRKWGRARYKKIMARGRGRGGARSRRKIKSEDFDDSNPRSQDRGNVT